MAVHMNYATHKKVRIVLIFCGGRAIYFASFENVSRSPKFRRGYGRGEMDHVISIVDAVNACVTKHNDIVVTYRQYMRHTSKTAIAVKSNDIPSRSNTV